MQSNPSLTLKLHNPGGLMLHLCKPSMLTLKLHNAKFFKSMLWGLGAIFTLETGSMMLRNA